MPLFILLLAAAFHGIVCCVTHFCVQNYNKQTRIFWLLSFYFWFWFKSTSVRRNESL